jgi:hypothetical protein
VDENAVSRLQAAGALGGRRLPDPAGDLSGRPSPAGERLDE